MALAMDIEQEKVEGVEGFPPFPLSYLKPCSVSMQRVTQPRSGKGRSGQLGETGTVRVKGCRKGGE